MKRDSLWQKWRGHYKSGGCLYAVYRGLKYIIWLIKKAGIDRQQREMRWRNE